jgi:cytochrome c oxidase subunit III
MSMTTVPARELPIFIDGPRAPGWWGMFFLILIETVVFTGLVVSYFFLRGYDTFPPAGIEKPELLLPTANSLVLAVSAVAIWFGVRAIKRGDEKTLKIWEAVGIALLVVFLVLKVVEYSGKDFDWTTHAYGSVVWTMIVLHSLHVAGVLLKAIPIAVLSFMGYFDEERHLVVETNALYWYFVVLIWLPLYFAIYLSPYIF